MSDIFDEVFGTIGSDKVSDETNVVVFQNEDLDLQIRTILNDDGSISFNAEDTAIGFGWEKTEYKNGKPYKNVRWQRMNKFSAECGFDHMWSKDDYMPESLFYMLGMKASNERALKYQKWIAIDVIPSIRKTGSYNIGMQKKSKQEKAKRNKLSSVNMMVKNIPDVLQRAGVEPVFIAAEVARLYTDQGYEVQAPLVTDKDTMPKLYDCTEIARELGIMSRNGKPHNQAVSGIIKKLWIADDEIVTTAFSKNGHEDVTTQYRPSVVESVREWLEENNYPTKIPFVDSKGNHKTRTVVYQRTV